MRGRRRVYGVEPLGGRDGAAEGLARGCVVPGVASTYRRIAEAAPARSSGSWKGDGDLRALRRQVPLLKLASRDSGVEMAVGDSPLATLPGSAQDFLDLEPAGSAEPPARRGRTLASQKLEQALERSRRLPPPPANLAGQRDSPQPPGKPECGVYLFGATEHECTGAETDPEAGLEGEVVARLEPGTWACLPGQGLRYLEHLCLVLEQLARLQQLYLQLWSQRLPGDPEGEESALAPAPLSSDSLGSGVQGPWELLHQTEQAGEAQMCYPLCPAPHPTRRPRTTARPGGSLFLALAYLILSQKGRRPLYPQRCGCPLPTLPGCRRPPWSQLTPHPLRDISETSPTGTRSRSCSTGSAGGILDTRSPLPLLVVLAQGLGLGTSLKGLSTTPTGTPICLPQWLRSNEPKTFLYVEPPGAPGDPGWSLLGPWSRCCFLCTAKDRLLPPVLVSGLRAESPANSSQRLQASPSLPEAPGLDRENELIYQVPVACVWAQHAAAVCMHNNISVFAGPSVVSTGWTQPVVLESRVPSAGPLALLSCERTDLQTAVS